MQIKKAGGKIFGASLTAAEQKAMNMEIQRQLVEYDRKNELELDAIILWELHTQLGLGPKRLKKFFDGFSDALNALWSTAMKWIFRTMSGSARTS